MKLKSEGRKLCIGISENIVFLDGSPYISLNASFIYISFLYSCFIFIQFPNSMFLPYLNSVTTNNKVTFCIVPIYRQLVLNEQQSYN